jgi:hypothetical protein
MGLAATFNESLHACHVPAILGNVPMCLGTALLYFGEQRREIIGNMLAHLGTDLPVTV